MGKNLLLISSNAEDQAFAAEVALASGLSLQVTGDPKEGAKAIAAGTHAIILADGSTHEAYQKIEDAIQETVGIFSEQINANHVHFISPSDLGKVPYLVQSPIFGHFVQRNYLDPKGAGQHYGRIVKATQTERAFGLKNLLGPTAKIQEVKLQQSTQKQSAVEAVKNYLLAAKFQSRMATVIANAVDELLMNAIFDAPADEMGRQTLASTARTAAFPLTAKNAVEMHVGFDGDYVGITAIDLFGSLLKPKLLSHISKIYTEQEYKVKTSIAGAGIGLATVFRSGGSFFFVSESHVRTEVTVFFRRTDNFREFKDQFRFISTQFYF